MAGRVVAPAGLCAGSIAGEHYAGLAGPGSAHVAARGSADTADMQEGWTTAGQTVQAGAQH